MGDLKSALKMTEAERDFAYDVVKEKNAEIERLREALRQIAKQWPDSFAARTARAALKGGE